MVDFADVLSALKGKDVYFYLDRELPDRESDDVNLVLHCGGKRFVISTSDSDNLMCFASSVHHFIDSRNILISWRVKEVFSFIRSKTGISLELSSNLYDIHLIDSYFGGEAQRPSSFSDAAGLLKSHVIRPEWRSFLDLYFNVYLPLSSSVLPEIENNCLTDNKRKACVYPTYVMEGQANGRLSALKVGRHSYNPHSIGPEEKSNLRPAGYDEVFVCFDYRNMEVNVLQWLSKDSELGDILKTDKDIYKEIWRRMTRIEPTDSHRSICKKIFLPVVFGLGRRTLAEKLGSSEEFAARLIDNFVDTFPVAFDWVKTQSADGNNVATDIFGRRRKFKPEQMYKIRNFVIQSPASMICLRKLVRLHEALSECGRIVFHIHDGYSLLCKRSEINSVFELGTRVLEDEEDLFPGLRLRTTCQVGGSLVSLEKINTGVVKA